MIPNQQPSHEKMLSLKVKTLIEHLTQDEVYALVGCDFEFQVVPTPVTKQNVITHLFVCDVSTGTEVWRDFELRTPVSYNTITK